LPDITFEELKKTLEKGIQNKTSKKIDEGYATSDVIIQYPSNVKVGEGTILNSGCILIGPITIGKYCLIGYRCMLFAEEHNFKPDKFICIQESRIEPIEIGDDVFLGAYVFITSGIKIGSHAIIGAGAVVTHNIPEWEIWAGTPARKIGDRRVWFNDEVITP
jgi:acetyltransferase-like isoleucine patch superfamily enzyme